MGDSNGGLCLLLVLLGNVGTPGQPVGEGPRGTARLNLHPQGFARGGVKAAL